MQKLSAKYLIIGGVAGGATTAARLRRMDEKAEIIIYEKGSHISYANCGLPYYIGNVIKEREKLLIQTPERFKARLNITVKVEHEVVAINRKQKSITVKGPDKITFEASYDKLVLSPGALPVIPPLEGIHDPAIFTVRNVNDTDQIKFYCTNQHPGNALVVGGGFIGLEMAENLRELGLKVTLAERMSQVMTSLDEDMAAAIHQQLRQHAVTLYLNNGVKKFHREGKKLSVTLEKGQQLLTDMVILSIGVKPATELAVEAGLKLASNGGIQVNSFLQTSDPDIYAVGDAIAFPHPISGVDVNTYLAGPANKQARIAADNIVTGNTRSYSGSIGTAIVKIFDLTAASTGLSASGLKKAGLPFVSSTLHGVSHAGYYPGALAYSLKIHFHPENGQLYGAQMNGYAGIDKRIDLLSTVIKNRGTIYDLEEIEQAYAPPYSAAKDPVNLAGFTAENIIRKKVQIIQWDKLQKEAETGGFLLDVRTPEEFALGNIAGSVNIELDRLRERLIEIPGYRTIIVYCGVGLRGYFAARILLQNGFDKVVNLSGGYKTYQLMEEEKKQQQTVPAAPVSTSETTTTPPSEQSLAGQIHPLEVDACGLQCPGPVIRLKEEIDRLSPGQRLLQKATDPGFAKDVRAWCHMTGNKLIALTNEKGIVNALIEKGTPPPFSSTAGPERPAMLQNDKTMVVFSDDLDKALATMVITNGALSMGRKVTLFFTFWGLNIIKKPASQGSKKDFMGNMLDKMMPSGAGKLKLSKMNMAGLGSLMMKKRMMTKKVDSIEDMIQTALANGVRMIACQMSMDVMGISKDELIEGVEIGGVATYLEASEKASLNLFI